jgi:hypothetical protein
MRVPILFVAVMLGGCASSQSQVAATSAAPTAAATATPTEAPTAAPAERPAGVKPGSPFVGEAAGQNDQYCRGKVNAYLNDGGGKQRTGETIDGAKCKGAKMQHAAWCHDDKTMIVCDQNVFIEVDCGQVVPAGVCGVLPNSGGSLDCVTP